MSLFQGQTWTEKAQPGKEDSSLPWGTASACPASRERLQKKKEADFVSMLSFTRVHCPIRRWHSINKGILISRILHTELQWRLTLCQVRSKLIILITGWDFFFFLSPLQFHCELQPHHGEAEGEEGSMATSKIHVQLGVGHLAEVPSQPQITAPASLCNTALTFNAQYRATCTYCT